VSAPYKAPLYLEPAFNCPQCGAYSNQEWTYAGKHKRQHNTAVHIGYIPQLYFAQCAHCNEYSIWHNEAMIYPFGGAAPLPNPDMPDDVKQDYEEARSILSISPRGAAALLRLAVQRLCKHLGEPGENINNDIKSLVQKGLPVQLQRALDSLRVAGNNAVHPGQLDLYDNADIATRLFGLLNVIVDNQITQPKAISELYDVTVPAPLQQAIASRDAPRPTGGGGAGR